MTEAYRICDWKERYEVTSGKHAWTPGLTEDGKKKKLRVRPLQYARMPVEGRGLRKTEEQRELEELVGITGVLICKGLYAELVVIAGDKEEKYRGWIVTGKLEAMDAALIAKRCDFDLEQVVIGMRALKTIGLIELKECEFAKECAQPVRFEDGNVKMGKLSSSNSFPESSGMSGNPSEPKPNTKEKVNITESEGAAGKDGEVAEIGEESGGLILAAAEESESKSVGPESENRGISESVGSESGESGNRACSSQDQRLKEPLHLAKPVADVHPVDGHKEGGNANNRLYWEVFISELDVKNDCPDCLLENVSENEECAREQIIHRVGIWFGLLYPGLEPLPTASEAVANQASVDRVAVERWCMAVWRKSGLNEIVTVIPLMQDVVRSCEKRGRRIITPMGVWVAKVKSKLGADWAVYYGGVGALGPT